MNAFDKELHVAKVATATILLITRTTSQEFGTGLSNITVIFNYKADLTGTGNHHHHHHHHHVACPELDVAVRTSLLHACRFCARW